MARRNRVPPPQLESKLDPIASNEVPSYLGGAWSTESVEIVKTLLKGNHEQEMVRQQNKARRLAKAELLHSPVHGTASDSSLQFAAAHAPPPSGPAAGSRPRACSTYPPQARQ